MTRLRHQLWQAAAGDGKGLACGVKDHGLGDGQPAVDAQDAGRHALDLHWDGHGGRDFDIHLARAHIVDQR